MRSEEKIGVSVVIPTYHRESILIETISHLKGLEFPANEIIVVDQTPDHEPETLLQLETWHRGGNIKWVRRDKPSITAAMNHGLNLAKYPLVLFVDDDIVPKPDLVLNHVRVHLSDPTCWVTAGQVIQPWQKPEPLEPVSKLSGLKKDFDFPFNSTEDGFVSNVIGCNFCVNKERAMMIGGFDENYFGSAFRFETDFAKRVVKAGGRIRFVASAGIDHLRVTSGGTRSKGTHMTSASPLHGLGDYYYAFRHGKPAEAWKYSVQRVFREVRTKFHLTHPWWIPVKMVGETRAILMARRTLKSGQKLIGKGGAA